MRKYLLYPVICFCCFFIQSCNITEGTTECDIAVQFVYDYNMQYVDLFHQQASIMDLYIFDEEGYLFTIISDHTGKFDEDYLINLPFETPKKVYQFVAWSGLYTDFYEYSNEISTIENFLVRGIENDPSEKIISRELPSLWHGKITEETGRSHEIKTINLMKNTKKFRLVIQSTQENNPITVEDFDVRILSSNNTYDHTNSILDDPENRTTYLPYYSGDDEATGASLVELNTLRLMENRENELIVTYKNNGHTFNLNLNNYLNALRLEKYSGMDFQEYLDREDSFYIILFLGIKDQMYVASGIQINGWYTRIQETPLD
ncbi:MAG: FimB/Mfa2 family fimbrial subunit [Tannerellaceae bacterium]|nr:FimB/Mfa2 family fimbrial subunit [Tannerellaceae bacterium]